MAVEGRVCVNGTCKTTRVTLTCRRIYRVAASTLFPLSSFICSCPSCTISLCLPPKSGLCSDWWEERKDDNSASSVFLELSAQKAINMDRAALLPPSDTFHWLPQPPRRHLADPAGHTGRIEPPYLVSEQRGPSASHRETSNRTLFIPLIMKLAFSWPGPVIY